MKAVWKFLLPRRPATHTVSVPAGFKFLSAEPQHGYVAIWCLVDPDLPPRPHEFLLVQTGETAWLYAEAYRATVQFVSEGGMPYVLHIFDQGVK